MPPLEIIHSVVGYRFEGDIDTYDMWMESIGDKRVGW